LLLAPIQEGMNVIPLRFAVPAIVGIVAVASTTAFGIGGSLAPGDQPAPPPVASAPAAAQPAAPATPAATVGASVSAPVVVVAAPVVLPPAGLQTGSTGAAVVDLQQRLHDLGYQARTATGSFDSETRHAVVAFQKLHGLARTGMFDAATRAALAAPQAAVAREGGEGLHMEVDIAHLVFVVQDGDVTAIYDASTGRAGWETSTGEFSILWRINGWRTGRLGPMYRPAYFTKDGVAFHGGEPVPTRAASHGCIRITDPSINELFDRLTVGTKVVVY
jgi:lipoprotein-anchoring transpeptidase ErfK/SrfK